MDRRIWIKYQQAYLLILYIQIIYNTTVPPNYECWISCPSSDNCFRNCLALFSVDDP